MSEQKLVCENNNNNINKRQTKPRVYFKRRPHIEPNVEPITAVVDKTIAEVSEQPMDLHLYCLVKLYSCRCKTCIVPICLQTDGYRFTFSHLAFF